MKKSLKSIYLGIDAGSISCKAVLADENGLVIAHDWQRHEGFPAEIMIKLLKKLFNSFEKIEELNVFSTGNGAHLLSPEIPFINEVICQTESVARMVPNARTVLEMGGQDNKLIFMEDGTMVDFSTNTNCAAGTGSFLDQQAERLGISVENEFGKLAASCLNPPRIAGRCSVFAKSDMIHLQQQGCTVEEILAGLCEGLVRSLKSDLCAGRKILKPFVFLGGVASNSGVARALKQVFELECQDLIIPELHKVSGAYGAVLKAVRDGGMIISPDKLIELLENTAAHSEDSFDVMTPLNKPDNTEQEKFKTEEKTAESNENEGLKTFIGVDVGSISTNIVAIDENGDLLNKAYLMTAGRPVKAVQTGLSKLRNCLENREISGVGVTGSGRYLIGDIIGADIVINEISAQAAGAAKVDPEVDTVFEIGGQDSKYISVEGGVVTDFEMNHACAAGTGSFLEEQAGRLKLSINNEFADAAFRSKAPVKLGERCTVFIETDLISHFQRGAARDDLVAGLAYSVASNYLNRVVGRRKIGKKVFFQGGTAFNKAVVAAFNNLLGRPVIVPEHHEVTGALGAAEFAFRKAPEKSKFRGFDAKLSDYESRNFECHECPNNCEIREIIREDKTSLYYGGRCDRFNTRISSESEIQVPDLFKERHLKLLEYASFNSFESSENSKGRIGIPVCLSNYQYLPLWSVFFNALGFNVVYSGETNGEISEKGVQSVLSQPCFPVKVAHGHVFDLIEKDVDYVWLPSIVSVKQDYSENQHNHLCPYVQAIPYQIRAAIELKNDDLTHRKYAERILDIPVRMDKIKDIESSLNLLCERIKISPSDIEKALRTGLKAQRDFEKWCIRQGRKVLKSLKPDQTALVVVGRPYNTCDPGVNMRLVDKLKNDGILAIPLDFLDLKKARVTNEKLQTRMYWKYGQNILRAANIIRDTPGLNAVYISNFSCGPDSFLIPLFKDIMSENTEGKLKPSLVLEIDEHSADAGIVTRIEAFHESLKSMSKRRLDSEKSCKKEVYNDKNNKQKSDESPDLSSRTLYIPWMGDHAHAIAAAFRHCGQDAEVLPVGNSSTLSLGRRYTTGKECLPCIITAGDMINRLDNEKLKPEKTAFFMPSCSGPCRFGLYSTVQELILKNRGVDTEVPIVSPNQNEKFYSFFKSFRRDPSILAYRGIASVDILNKALLKSRPYEKKKGAADIIYNDCLKDIIRAVEQGSKAGEFRKILFQHGKKMRCIMDLKKKKKPKICVVGEIYVRNHPFANNDLIKRLESYGAQVELAGITEWFYYTNYMRMRSSIRRKKWWHLINNLIQDFFQHHIERSVANPLERLFGELAEKKISTVLKAASPYLHDSFEGEAVLSVGKMAETAPHGIAGAVNVMPFGCMPSTVVSALSRKLSYDQKGLPIISVSCDGQGDSGIDTRLEAFMYQADAYIKEKERPL